MISSRTDGKDSGDRTLDAVSRNTAEQVDKANASGRTPVVFVHGLWLLPSNWDRPRGSFCPSRRMEWICPRRDDTDRSVYCSEER